MNERAYKSPARILLAICLSLQLVACGGGGSGSGGGGESSNVSIIASKNPEPNTAIPLVNSAPTLSGVPATSVTAGNVYSFQPIAVDSDGDSLVFSIENSPSWASFDTSTGLLSGTPAASDAGNTDGIVISVSDGLSSAATAPFSIRVNQDPVVQVITEPTTNSAPTLSDTPATSVTAGDAYSFQPVAVDSNGDPSVNTAPPIERKYHPGHYVQMYQTDGAKEMLAAIKPNVVGMVRYYWWQELETSTYINGVLVPSYDFSKIQVDMDLLAGQGMRLIVQVADKTFNGTMPTPLYLQGAAYTQPNQNGGYTAVRWNPFVIARYKALLDALGKQFDGQPNFEGVATAESAIGFDSATLSATGYTPELYRDALINVLGSAAQSFPTSRVFWFMNYIAGKQGYIADVATAVIPYGVIMGGPDVLPDDPDLQKLTYHFYDDFNGKMKLFGSMMSDSYRELHTDTTYPTKYWTMDEMFSYARDNLHVNYVFWTKVSVASPADSYKWNDAIPVIGANPAFNLN